VQSDRAVGGEKCLSDVQPFWSSLAEAKHHSVISALIKVTGPTHEHPEAATAACTAFQPGSPTTRDSALYLAL
jgi:hypothetical protein